jgi:hypothetical protein
VSRAKRSWWRAYGSQWSRIPPQFLKDPHHSCARPQPALKPRAGDIQLGNGLRLNFAPKHVTEEQQS